MRLTLHSHSYQNMSILIQIYVKSFPLETEDLYLIISDGLLRKYFSEQYPACKTAFMEGVSVTDFPCSNVFTSCLQPPARSDRVKTRPEWYTAVYAHKNITDQLSCISLCGRIWYIFQYPHAFKSTYTILSQNVLNHCMCFPVMEFQGTRKTLLLYHKK